MSLPPLPLIDGCLFVDNSMMELLTTCSRALEYNKLYQRVSAISKPSLSFGSAIHSALEYRYKVYKSGAVDPYCEDAQRAILTRLFDANPPPIDDWRNLNWCVEVNRRYNEQYRREDFDLLKYETPIKCTHCNGTGEVPVSELNVEVKYAQCLYCSGTGRTEMMVELPFALPLYEHDAKRITDIDGSEYTQPKIKVMYSGRIDLPVQLDNMIFVMDHKTTSILGSQFFERAAMMAQQKGYCWSFQQLTGKRVYGYYVNALRTKEPPQYINDPTKALAKNQSPEKWWKESFQRERYYVTPEILDEWKQNTIELCEEFFWRYDRGYMPMKTAWCTQYGKCQYYDVCTLPPQQRHMMLQSNMYQDNKWSPLLEPSDALQ